MSFFKKIFKEPRESTNEPIKPEQGQLLQILDKIKADPKIYPEILQQLVARNPNKFKSLREAERYVESATTDADALGFAKLIDHILDPRAQLTQRRKVHSKFILHQSLPHQSLEIIEICRGKD